MPIKASQEAALAPARDAGRRIETTRPGGYIERSPAEVPARPVNGKPPRSTAGKRWRHRKFLSLSLLLLALIPVCAGGCGSRPSAVEETLDAEVRSALTELSASNSFSFRLRMEIWVGVSGYTVYGEERGEGSLEGDDLTLEILRISPEGEDRFTISRREGDYFLLRDGLERPADGSEVPGPLFRPREFLALFSRFRDVREEGEEEREGEICRVFRLDYDPSLALEALPPQAKEYFTNLDYELSGRLWLGERSPYPVAISLELTGLDPAERLQRLRMVFTFQPLAAERP